ncbi:hypothetical protein AALB53_24955, partial [Lachnospiraceae bacterium 47-T17]
MTQQFITMTITITVKIPVPPTPPAPTGAKVPEPVFLFREGQPPLCRCKVRYVLFGKLSAPTFFTLNAPVFQMVWIN